MEKYSRHIIRQGLIDILYIQKGTIYDKRSESDNLFLLVP